MVGDYAITASLLLLCPLPPHTKLATSTPAPRHTGACSHCLHLQCQTKPQRRRVVAVAAAILAAVGSTPLALCLEAELVRCLWVRIPEVEWS